MANFNTNQTRHLYVAKSANTAQKGGIELKATADGKTAYFVFRNYDDLVTRTDLLTVSKITSVKCATTLQSGGPTGFGVLGTPLLKKNIAVDTTKLTLGAVPVFANDDHETLIGKAINLIVTIHGVFDYDLNNSTTFTASITGSATNLASPAAFAQAMAIAVAKAMPQNDPKHPFIVVKYDGSVVTKDTEAADIASGTATAFVLEQGPQKFVRGKLTGEPCLFSCYGRVAYKNLEDINWVAESELVPSGNYIHGAKQLADLERFAYGERGDVYREFAYPNNYETHYEIDASGETEYDVISIEYYWSGDAENVQKSPRLLEIVAVHNTGIVEDIKSSIEALLNPSAAAIADLQDAVAELQEP